MRYLITISYDGSAFYGFQRLNKYKTVQKELEEALSKINKKDVVVKGSGRTDRQVHALNQKCHFDLDIKIPPDRLKNAINSLICDELYVKDCEYVTSDFHARFCVKKKVYKYLINIGEYDPIKNNYVYNYCRKLNIKKMQQASKLLIGKRSFKPFVSGQRENYDSEIYDIKITKANNIITIKFIGKSFYRYMVRNMVGALLLVGQEKITLENFKNLVMQKSKITYLTVPANGLYLENVYY